MTDVMAPRGLNTEDARRLLATEGHNRVVTAPPPRLVRRVARQFADPLVALLLVSAAVTTFLGDLTDTAVIVLVIAVNTAIGVTQEVRAERAIAALQRLGAPTVRVVRDGVDQVLPAADLVRGDLVVLGAGDVIPADLVVDEAQRLRIDESMLTGESVTVSRDVADELAAGTVVVTGRATGTVIRLGTASALGRIAALVASTHQGQTPLQRRLVRLGRLLGVIAVAASAVVMAVGLLSGQPLEQMAITAVSLVVAAVPESLPAVVTLALALGAFRMARGHAVARRLHAVETLGSVSVVASDKTGTLTQSRMAVERAVTAAGSFRTRGTGYDPAGAVVGADGDEYQAPVPSALLDLGRAAVLCNDATLRPPEHHGAQWTAVGDPLEAALVAFGARCGIDVDAERAAAPRIAEEPFDAESRRMLTFHAMPDGRVLALCKGAPEAVLNSSTVTATPAELAGTLVEARELAAGGTRVLAFAADVREPGPEATRPTGLRPLGLLAVADPLRPEAADVASAFASAGIRLVLITGDHPATATSIAEQIGIWKPGDAVRRGDRDDLDEAPPAQVYARILPEQKLDIIAALQRDGQIVAMTGDGVNDAPALRKADIGVAMGAGGTEVARQAADLVLTDDNLATVAVAVGEGRRIYDNIRRFLRYALAGGLAELLVMLLGPLFGLAVPLLPAQILWINLLTHGVPGVALGAEPASPDIMRRRPRPPRQSVLGAGLARTIVAAGTLMTMCVLFSAAIAQQAGLPWRSVAFVVLGFAQLGVAVAVRARRVPGGDRNPGLAVAIAVSAVLQAAAVMWTPLRELLRTEPLSMVQLGLCVLVAMIPGAVLAAAKAVRRHA
jgi:Ca2+-transporting ATPase